MARVNPNRLGMVLAVMMAAWHGLWLLLVATGVGQTVADFVLRLHFMEPDVTVQPITLGGAAALVAVAAAAGYVAGVVGASLWNCLSAWCVHESAGVTTMTRSPAK
jgi:fructose-1,6-bisphosphatase/inositol monophosphatase family enzyme